MWTVQLAQTYELDLQTSRLKKIDWASLGVKAKMRRFFANNQWPPYIKQVGASSGGKQGVLFLYKADPQNTTKVAPAPSYVVKLTDAPQRILFAEYVLKNLAGAKIPKSLIVPLDWGEYPDDLDQNINLTDAKTDDGLKLLHILRNPRLRHPSIAAGSQREVTYRNNVNKLSKTASQRPSYLVIMKGFPLAKPDLRMAVNDPFERVIPDPWATPNPPGTPSIAYPLSDLRLELQEWLEGTNANWLQRLKKTSKAVSFADLQADPTYHAPEKLKEIVWAILINKRILARPDLLRKAGRVLAADTLLRNGDRLGGAGLPNLSNILFVKKHYGRPTKDDNPVAVIDNDALLTVYNPASPPCEELGLNRRHVDTTALYLSHVLKGGNEISLSPGKTEIGPDAVMGVDADQVIRDFDTVIFTNFVEALNPPTAPKAVLQFQLLRDLYKDDGTLVLGTARAGTYRSFSDDPRSQEWQAVRTALKAGFADGLDAILKMKQRLPTDYLPVYSHLQQQYGFDNDFDFKTLEVTQAYLASRTQVMKSLDDRAMDFQEAMTHDEALDYIKRHVLETRYPLCEGVRNALAFGVQEQLIDASTRDDWSRYITCLASTDQQKFVIGTSKQLERQKRIHVVCLALVKLFVEWVSESLTNGKALSNAVANYRQEIESRYIHNLSPEKPYGNPPYYKADDKKIKLADNTTVCKTLAQLDFESRLKIAPYFPPELKDKLALT